MNLIIIIADSLRKDHVGCYGNFRIRTPNIDAFAKMSVRFTNMYPESLPTLPFRRAIHTGMRAYPFRNHRGMKWDIVRLAGWGPIPEEQDTLSEILERRGYRNYFITDTLPYFQPSLNFHRGFHHYAFIRGQQQDRWLPLIRMKPSEFDKLFYSKQQKRSHAELLEQYFSNISTRRSEEDWFAPQVYRRAMSWLEGAAAHQPFFMLIDTFDPHEPWDPPEYYTRMYDSEYCGDKNISVLLYGKSDPIPADILKNVRARYAGEVTMVDSWFGFFMEKIEALGLLGDTLIFFVSDHGHLLGEHNLVGKLGYGLYKELVDIPAIYYDPALSDKGGACDALCYNIDIISTILRRLEIEPETPREGINLYPIIEGKQKGPRHYLTCSYNDWVWVRKDNLVANIHYGGRPAWLCDIKDDADEKKNIAPERDDVVRELFELALKDAGGRLPIYEELRTTFADGTEMG